VKLYVCWGTFGTDKQHPCAKAFRALQSAGYEPEVVKTYGCYGTDRLFKGRCEVKRLTGNFKVPTLILGDDSIIDSSDAISAWAAEHPA